VKLVALRMTTPRRRENTKSGRMNPDPAISPTRILPPARHRRTTKSVLIRELAVTASSGAAASAADSASAATSVGPVSL
jgi:hypothetical protein